VEAALWVAVEGARNDSNESVVAGLHHFI